MIVAHPYRKVCGATNAGRDLSVATAELTPLELAIMWDADEQHRIGALDVRHVRCTNLLGPLAKHAPRALSIPLVDSPLPEMIEAGSYELIHIHNLFPPRAAERIVNACHRSGTPYVITTHGFHELRSYAEMRGFKGVMRMVSDRMVGKPFERMVAGATGFFALSEFDVDLLRGMGVPSERIHLVTNGVNDYYLETPTADEMTAVREKFRLGSAPKLLYMGSLHGYKGVDTFLESLKQLRGDFQAVVAGRFKDPSEPDALMTAAGLDESVRRRVVFTGGVSDAELRALYRSADIFVYPTRGDTLPLVVLEAMAGGLPIVSTTVGGVPFQVQSDCGLLAPPSDPTSIASATQELLDDEERRRAMGRKARLRVLAVFRWHLAARQAVIGYSKLLGKPVAELATVV
ncbi:MAG: glycosyltransferase family 4 protein [Bryobacterales bacterium]|nr:glycosyltransferase family 4 protein [Bryobacterales bacterium]